MTNQATPARARPFNDTAVSSAPQSLPLSYQVCCMRLSLLSRPPGRTVFGSYCCPRMSCEHGADATQSPSGVWPDAGWLLRPGCTYFSNGTDHAWSAGDGWLELSDAVLVSDQRMRLFATPWPSASSA